MIELLHLLSKSESARAGGCAPKYATCEQCGGEFVYLIERKASANEGGFVFENSERLKERAHAKAEKRLAKLLAEGCEPVPCPDCGHYQAHMIGRARRLRFGWMAKWALYLFLLSIPFGVMTVVFLSLGPPRDAAHEAIVTAVLVIFGACFSAAALLPLARLYCGWRYDPNRIDIDERIGIGRELAVKPDQAWRLVNDREEEEE